MATQTARMQRGGEMPRAYDPRAVEGGIYDFWESDGYFVPSVPPEEWNGAATAGRSRSRSSCRRPT